MKLECKDCCYCWQNDGEKYPSCKWESRCPDDKAPCEYDEYDYVNEEENYDY